MKHTSTRQLYDYWQRLRGSRPAPDRTEIEPADIRRILGDTFILEVTADRDHRFRLAGTRVCALYGRELKGRSFLDLWTGKDRDTMATMLAAITQDAAAAVFGVGGRADHGRDLPCEVLMLPVRQRGEGWTRVIGSFVPMEDPYWIGLHPIVSQSITSLRLIWPDERPYFMRADTRMDRIDDRPAAPIRSVPHGLGAMTGPSRRIGHLVVFDGGKSS
jgi:hypothetical protein